MTPINPIHQMEIWDKEGNTYFISLLYVSGQQLKYKRIDVIEHYDEWILVRANKNVMWINIAQISAISLVKL